MKSTRIIYWITTSLVFLWEGVMPALTGQSEMAKEGIAHLGYPEYFGLAILFFKIPGALALIIPAVPPRLKEWAYAGFTFNFIWAIISHWAVDGFGAMLLFPVLFLAIHLTSYFSWHKLRKTQPAG
ncbi:MAG TPA: DoxX family protein [Cryomorphaceae bacterium]|nr:hypothetical protein [Owenweeksia sp.]MBF98546.1 hypothetical protein [Owenweeksia sp.]HAD96100.1 DoxX family protein [Cryomorphaceae bacterium]HBF18502.1 DoxX family protein [Cryomorphaceae bacterium]HCQ16980.1 DoxX family protein [Cryomorphaceae bacterium]|tara:strand:+ start:1214 stop:1591 length:378 start_codon:yes stop_codon:yes gene_type:complete